MTPLSDLVAPYRSHIQQGTKVIFGLLFAVFALKYLRVIWDNLSTGNIWFNDFFNIWSFAKFIIINPAVSIYDNSILQEFRESLGAAPYTHVPYPYPPSFLLLSLPLGFMSYYVAYGMWILSTFVSYCIASLCRQWRASAALIILLAPATILTFAFGQTGFLSSALIIGGFRLAGSRPIQSGVLLGLVSLKPQLGILIPVALISARLWRTLIAAGLTVLVLVLASSVAFGWSIWPIWLAKLPVYADWASQIKTDYKPTITASLTALGINLAATRVIQLFVAVVVAAIIWVCFRGGVTMLATAALIVGTLLATPYAFIYDMAMVTNAVLIVVHDKQRTKRRLMIPEMLILLLALSVPAIMMETWRFFLAGSIGLILLFGLIVWRIFTWSGSDPELAPS